MNEWTTPLLRGPSVEFAETLFWDKLEDVFRSDRARVVATDAADGSTITVGELKARSKVLAHVVVQLNRSAPVGLCIEPSIDMLVAFVGLARLGASYVGIDPSIPADRIAFIAQESGIDTVIISSRQKQQVNFHTLNVIDVTALPESNGTFHESLAGTKTPEADAVILYTSGSTGKPRGVRLSYRALTNRLMWQWQQNPFQDNDVVGARTKIGFVDSLAEMWAPLLQGRAIVYISPSIVAQPHKFLETIDRFHISVITVVPSLLRSLLLALTGADTKLSSLRQVISSGDMLTLDLCERFFHCLPGRKLTNYYGMTETMGDVSGIIYEDMAQVRKYAHHHFLSVGPLVNNTSMFLHDTDEEGIGELVFSGKNLATGYLDEDQDDRFIQSSHPGHSDDQSLCFRAGDRGKVVDGNLVVVGRIDRQIKVGGNRVDLSEVEAIIQEIFDFDVQPVLVSYRDRVVACYEQAPTSGWTVGMERIKQWLPSYAVPAFVQVSSIPRLASSGKVDRRQLQEFLRMRDEGLVREQKAVLQNQHTWTTAQVSSLIRALEMVGLDASNPETLLKRDFFSVGGTSLNALAVIQTLKSMGHNVTLEQFFSAPSLKALSESMSMTDTIDSAKLESQTESKDVESICKRNNWSTIPVTDTNKEAAATLVGVAFTQEILVTSLPTSQDADFTQKITPQTISVMRAFSPYFSRPTTEEHISIALQNSQGRLIAANLALDDAFQPSPVDDPDIFAGCPDIEPLLEFLDSIETPVVNELKHQRGLTRIMHGMALGVDWSLIPDSRGRIEAVLVLERELLDIARRRGYQAVVSVNTSPTTRDVAVYLGYTVAHTVEKVGEYMDDSERVVFPFAPRDASVCVCYRLL